MQQALLVRLRPLGPWRFGPSDGAADRVDTLFRSDRLFSAVTLAMRQLGQLEPWLDSTARSSERPAVAFTSLFPFQGETLFVIPPATLWPPPSSLVNSPSPVFLTKVRWRAAQFVPAFLVDALMTGQPVLADQWIPDADSGCLLRRDRPGSSPFRKLVRRSAPVDRMNLTSAGAAAHACVEFENGSGLWTLVRFADEKAQEVWQDHVRSAFRLLSDSGFGGGRSKGWGQVEAPEFESGAWPALLLPKVARAGRNADEAATSRSYWLLSLYSPALHDRVNWSGGQYQLVLRNGRVDASSQLKKSVQMVEEGCVLDCDAEPVGRAVDVAPQGFDHPVYRSGIALTLLIPPPKPASDDRRAIEEIVPPELEAVPFPMPVPPPVVETPEPEPERHPDPEPVPQPETRPDAHPELPAEPVPHEPLHPEPVHHPEVTPDLEPKHAPEMPGEPERPPQPEVTPEPEITPSPEPAPETPDQPSHHPETVPSVEPKHAPEVPTEPAHPLPPEITPLPKQAPETPSEPHHFPEVTPDLEPKHAPEMPHTEPSPEIAPPPAFEPELTQEPYSQPYPEMTPLNEPMPEMPSVPMSESAVSEAPQSAPDQDQGYAI